MLLGYTKNDICVSEKNVHFDNFPEPLSKIEYILPNNKK